MSNPRTSFKESRTSTRTNSTIEKDLIKSIILTKPKQTTHFATNISEAKLKVLLTSSDNRERMFANICQFARGDDSQADEFSQELLTLIQAISASPDHAKYCIYFYEKADDYLSEPLKHEIEIRKEYDKLIIGAERQVYLDRFKVIQDHDKLLVCVFKWLKEIDKTKIFAPQDAFILLFLAELSKNNHSISCMVGHILARHQEKIHVDVLVSIHLQLDGLKGQSDRSEAFRKFIFHRSVSVSTGRHMAYAHDAFNIPNARDDHGGRSSYIELPNAAIANMVEQIIATPEVLIDCWLQYDEEFNIHNLMEMRKYYPALDSALNSSKNAEIQTLLKFCEFTYECRRVFSEEIFETTLAATSDRLKKMVVRKHVESYTADIYVSDRKFDAGLHAVMTAALSQYPEDEYMQRLIVKLDQMRPRDYKEQVTEGLSAASTTVSSYVKPWTDSVANQTSLLFAKVQKVMVDKASEVSDSLKNGV